MTKFIDNKIGAKALSGTVFRIDPSFLDADICRFLSSRQAGCSLYYVKQCKKDGNIYGIILSTTKWSKLSCCENLIAAINEESVNAKSFLVACYATLHPTLSVRPSVRRSVGPSHFPFFLFLRSTASLLLPK